MITPRPGSVRPSPARSGRLTRLGLLAALALAGCRAAPHLEAPGAFTLLESGDFDALQLTWEPRCTSCTFELQARVAGGPFGDVLTRDAPPGTFGVVLQFGPAAPEATLYEFRVRAVTTAAVSAWTPVLPYLRRLRPPSSFTATASPFGQIALSWTNASTAATALLLERSADGGAWEPLPVAFPLSGHLDEDYPELAQLTYRLRFGKGEFWSADRLVTPSLVPLRQPEGLSVVMQAGGPTFSWRNRSAAASAVLLRRTTGTTVALLPAAAEAGSDAEWPPWPSARYFVEAAAAGVLSVQHGALPTVGLPPFELAGPTSTLFARTEPLGGPVALARSGDGGAWRIVPTRGQPPYALVHPTGALDPHLLVGRALAWPGLLLDAGGRPHVVSLAPEGQGFAVWHDWHDGSGWRSSSLGNLDGVSNVSFGIDAAGAPQLLALGAVTPDRRPLLHAEEVGGVLVVTEVPLPPLDLFGVASMAVGPDGTATVVGGPKDLLALRSPGGAWVTEPTPPEFHGSTVSGPAPELVQGGGQVALVTAGVAAWPTVAIRAAWRGPGGWGPVLVTETEGTSMGLSPVRSLAAGPDGSRLSLVLERPAADLASGRQIDLLELAGGQWRRIRLAPDSGVITHGYDLAGRTWIVGNPVVDLTVQPSSIWEER
ncbi:MAG: hypothetical protein IPO09_19960 [Anaeromyxobacter sp.]|nr:hypothetical protein [Anaeromyxobacter sp.]